MTKPGCYKRLADKQWFKYCGETMPLIKEQPELGQTTPALCTKCGGEYLLKEAQSPKLGPTGKFPDGQITKNDEGEITIGIKAQDGAIIIEFGKSIHWIGFTPEQARAIAESLYKHADLVTKKGT